MTATDGPRRAALHEKLLDRHDARGEALYMLVCGFLAITVNGVAVFLLKQPLLFPRFSPTVFTIFLQPLAKDASPATPSSGTWWPSRSASLFSTSSASTASRACCKRA